MNSSQALIKKQQKLSRLIEKGKFKEAIKPLGQLCKLQPENTKNWLTLASLYGQTNDFHSVIKVCQRLEPKLKDNPTIFSLLGNAHASLGNTTEAHKYYRKALDIQPDDPGLLNNLGNALYLDNKLEEAADIFLRVVNINPGYADAHNNLGNIYKAMNENELAVKHYEYAVNLNPNLSKTYLNLGHMFADRIGHPELAEKNFRNALRVEPENLEAMSGVTNMLRFQGKLDEALEMIKQTQKLYPDEIGVIAAEADIYERTGDYEDAHNIVRDMLSKDLIHPMLIDVLMRICQKFDCCEEAIERGEKVAKAADTSATYRQNTHFGLGKLYDKLERYDEAFNHYKAGNEVLEIPFDKDLFKRRVDGLISTYSAESIQKFSSSDIDTKLPVFIVGMPRSGTSLTEQILSSHPDVGGAGELNDINDIVAGIQNTLNTSTPYPECISLLDTASANSLAMKYMEKLKALCGNKKHITDKMPHNFLNLGLISLLFPEAKIINCVRDPRDTCLSIYFQSFGWLHPYGTRLDWLGFYYNQYARLMQHWAKSLNIKIHTISYDDMVNDQEKTTREMLDYCGLEWDDACLDFHKSKRVVATASYDQVKQKIYTKSQARWKKYKSHLGLLIENLDAALDNQS